MATIHLSISELLMLRVMHRTGVEMSAYDIARITRKEPVGMGVQTCYRNMRQLAEKQCVDFVETVPGKTDAIPKKIYRINALGQYFVRQFDEYLAQ